MVSTTNTLCCFARAIQSSLHGVGFHFPLYWRPCFDLWIICYFVERGSCRCQNIHLFSPISYICTKIAMSKNACCMGVLMLPPEKKYLMSRLNKSACVRHCHAINVLLFWINTGQRKTSFFIQINFAKAVHLMTSQT